jgi:hypothetical protein
MNDTDFRILLQPSSTCISPVVTRSISCSRMYCRG